MVVGMRKYKLPSRINASPTAEMKKEKGEMVMACSFCLIHVFFFVPILK